MDIFGGREHYSAYNRQPWQKFCHYRRKAGHATLPNKAMISESGCPGPQFHHDNAMGGAHSRGGKPSYLPSISEGLVPSPMCSLGGSGGIAPICSTSDGASRNSPGRSNCFRKWVCHPSQVNHIIPGNWGGILGMMFSLIFRITSSEDNGSWEVPLATSVTTEKNLPGGVVASAHMSKDVRCRETDRGNGAPSHAHSPRATPGLFMYVSQ